MAREPWRRRDCLPPAGSHGRSLSATLSRPQARRRVVLQHGRPSWWREGHSCSVCARPDRPFRRALASRGLPLRSVAPPTTRSVLLRSATAGADTRRGSRGRAAPLRAGDGLGPARLRCAPRSRASAESSNTHRRGPARAPGPFSTRQRRGPGWPVRSRVSPARTTRACQRRARSERGDGVWASDRDRSDADGPCGGRHALHGHCGLRRGRQLGVPRRATFVGRAVPSDRSAMGRPRIARASGAERCALHGRALL